ncbi:DUF962 domain-containing protein [Leptospira bouyouniensis]|uniref:DUF962 domain-containing protein n=1 Tax=Leptospira bouyouniensis TaxID=2484911 RepID=UPI00109101D1|nr:DUF962 domain-containing protein [Leptospira bouyouniensis]TGM87319.1 DUF962 domain-containing protein [Leptospira bouyouniensis]
MEKKYKTLKDFLPFYLEEHSHPFNRALHFIGSSLALGCILGFIATGKLYILGLALVSGYFFAWVGHFFVEKNRPATFTYPIYSFISDWIMYFKMLTGRIDVEFAKIKSKHN